MWDLFDTARSAQLSEGLVQAPGSDAAALTQDGDGEGLVRVLQDMQDALEMIGRRRSGLRRRRRHDLQRSGLSALLQGKRERRDRS